MSLRTPPRIAPWALNTALVFALLAGAWPAAWGQAPPALTATPVELDLSPVEPAPSPNAALHRQLCNDRHWVAVSTQAVCPPIPGWNAAPLFRGELHVAHEGQPLICRYDRPAAPAPSISIDAAIGNLQHNESVTGAVRRCGVLATLGTTQDPTLAVLNREVFYRELRFQVGATDLPKLPNPPQVRLAILDTQPTGNGVLSPSNPASSGHGFGISRIAQDLTCTGAGCDISTCAAQITRRLALPQQSPAADPKTPKAGVSGSYGTPSDLATAIVDEVDDWRKLGEQTHLILNLSVGWDSSLLHDRDQLAEADSKGVNAEEIAVYEALAYATQKGALAIAAAGNRRGGVRPENGALLPAGWYANPPAAPGLSLEGQDPVVWAISAIDRHGNDLANTRPGSTSELVAYGDHAVVPVGSGLWTEPLTGSSVSAVVASSLAALVWNYRSDLEASGVMALLAASAVDLGRPAAIFPSAARPTESALSINWRQISHSGSGPVQSHPVKRLEMFSAVSYAWSPMTLKSAVEASVPKATGSISLNQTPTATSNRWCGQGPTFIMPGTATPPSGCPPHDLHALSEGASVQTQPQITPCPNCLLAGGPPPPEGQVPKPCTNCPVTESQTARLVAGANQTSSSTGLWELFLEIPLSWNECISSPLIEVERPSPDVPQYLWLQGPLCGNDSIHITGIPFAQDIVSATLSGKVTENGIDYSVSTPLYVAWRP